MDYQFCKRRRCRRGPLIGRGSLAPSAQLAVPDRVMTMDTDRVSPSSNSGVSGLRLANQLITQGSSAATTWAAVRGQGIAGEMDVLMATWLARPLTPASQARLGELMRRFATRLSASGVPSLTTVGVEECEAFLWAPTRRNAAPSIHTVHLRRTALRDLFSVLGDLDASTVDPSRVLDLPAREGRQTRPLTEAEMTLVRTAALGRSRDRHRAVSAISLAEATATTGELAQIRWSAVDLAVGTVLLPGASPVEERTGAFSAWGKATLTRVANEVDPAGDDWVIPRRAHYGESHSAQAAMANLLTKVLASAGLKGSGVRPGSIRLWGGSHVLAERGIEAAAVALGIQSLDATRRALSPEVP